MQSSVITFPERYDLSGSATVDFALHRALAGTGLKIHPRMDTEEFMRSLTNNKIDLQLTFDLQNTGYIELAQLVWLLVLGRFCFAITGKGVRVVFPREQRIVDKFMSPWNFFEFFYDWGIPVSPLKETVEPFSPRNSLPITRIAQVVDVQRTTRVLKKNRIRRHLNKNFGFQSDHLKAFVDSIVSEFCENIPLHSMDEGFIAIQMHVEAPNVYTAPDYEPKIDVIISDGGIGILQSLRKKEPRAYGNKSASQALNDVLEGRVPQREGRQHGGIFRAKRDVQKLGGAFTLSTPFAMSTTYPNRLVFFEKQVFFPGTHIAMKIPRASFRGGLSDAGLSTDSL